MGALYVNYFQKKYLERFRLDVWYIVRCKYFIRTKSQAFFPEPSLPSMCQFLFFETLMAQCIIATLKKKKKCLGNEVTKTTAFAKMLFAIAQTFLPFITE